MLVHPLSDSQHPCSYLPGREACLEQMAAAKYSSDELEFLLASGWRHFGNYFFHPVCDGCGKCLPIRLNLRDFKPGKNFRKLLKKSNAVTCRREHGRATDEKFQIYLEHLKRFSESGDRTFEGWSESFFSESSLRTEQLLYLNDELIAVTHLDVTNHAISAVYCYWKAQYADFSPGKLSILKEALWAAENGKDYLYLGFYVPGSPAMLYKETWYPTEVFNGTSWIAWRNAAGAKVWLGDEISRLPRILTTAMK